MTNKKLSTRAILIVVIIILSLSLNTKTILINQMLNAITNSVRYIIAVFFIMSVLVLKKAALFHITKRNKWALFYLILTGLSCFSILTMPGLNYSNAIGQTILVLSNPAIAILMSSAILKNPARFGRRIGMFFSFFGMLAVLV